MSDQNLYLKGIIEFQKGNEDEALEILKQLINQNPCFSDAYETIGVILGRQSKYKEAISYMDKLLEVNPSSILAHTNKSLFYMNLGEIEKAEEEKALATTKTFEANTNKS